MPAVKSTDPENFKKLMTSINEQASADQALAEQLMEDIVMRAQMRQLTREEAMAELNKVKEKFDKKNKLHFASLLHQLFYELLILLE